jgi:threonine synthase
MRPWAQQHASVATGILDDETYDWRAVVEGMLLTGGRPLVVSEDSLVEASRLAAARTGIPVDPTGSSGLAGLLELRRSGQVGDHDRVAVLFTGRHRDPPAGHQGWPEDSSSYLEIDPGMADIDIPHRDTHI